MPRTPETLESVANYLKTRLPGGKYIEPHWQDGPFWLVPIRSDCPNWQVEILLDAHDPVASNLAMPGGLGLAPATVYAVGAFTRDMLEWHNDPEVGLEVCDEKIVGPFEQTPTAADLVAHLPALFYLTDRDGAVHDDEVIALMSTLQGADPGTVLSALSSWDSGSLDDLAEEYGDDYEGLAKDFLTTVAGIATDPTT